MNSISYLDSVLSRSFAAAPERPASRASASAKRSRSHSSLPGSRRASSTSPSTPSGSSHLRRWSQEQDEVRPVYANALRRTGSTPSGINNPLALTDDSDDDSLHPRPARWSGLWGLTGWLDEAIHPGSRARSRKNSDAQATLRRSKRAPSLDDLLLSSTAPRRSQARRTASSGAGQPHAAQRDPSSSSSDEASGLSRRRSRRQPRFGQAASLTLTTAQDPPLEPWAKDPQQPHHHDDPDLLTEKEREDIVEFDGGDFAPEDIERPRHRTISQSSLDSSWGQGSSVSHETHPAHATITDASSGQAQQKEGEQQQYTQDRHDENAVDAETLLEAAKGEPAAIEAVADRDPASAVVDPEAAVAASASATPKKETSKAVDSESETTPTQRRSGTDALDVPGSGADTPSASRRSSLRRNASTRSVHGSVGSVGSTSTSSLASTDSAEQVERSLTPSKPRRRSSKRGSRSSSARASETDEARGWLAPRNGSHELDEGAAKGGGTRGKRGGSTKRTVYRALVRLRDVLVAVLLCPVYCVRYLRRRRALRVEQAVEAVYERAQVPILEKNAGSMEEKRTTRPASLRFVAKAEAEREKRSSAVGARPRTPKPDVGGWEEKEPVTEEQAAERGIGWQALASGPRTPSRLLPNPQAVDPMLAHNAKAEPVDLVMAEHEARMEAERQSRIARGRAARRAAASGLAGANAETTTAVMMQTKVPRAPTSSIIHHSPKILVLDLDETLIHSTSRSPAQYATGRTTTSGFLGLETAGAVLGLRANDNPRRIRPHMVEVVLDGRSVLYHVYKRPWADYFLRKVASWYTVVVFTASVQEYADPVIDWLDQGRGLISARLFRESCSFSGGSYVKNLAVVDPDLSKVCLVDNSPASYAINRANGIPIEGWTHDPNDEALLDLLPILDSLRFATDVRHILGIRGW